MENDPVQVFDKTVLGHLLCAEVFRTSYKIQHCRCPDGHAIEG